MSKNVSEKMALPKQKKKGSDNQNAKTNKFLITVNVLGSAGPLRFVVSEGDLVSGVIDTALKSYAREGRLPVLGTEPNNCLLYYANAGSDALNPWEPIGCGGGRNFMLCKKQMQPNTTNDGSPMTAHKGSGWRAWINKSFAFKISSH